MQWKCEKMNAWQLVHGHWRADHEGGFIADVKYEGAAVYPEPHHGPAPYAPAHPAPLAHR